ncbi:unnamed protein product [Hermetia illucens]|uniref:Meckelin n=1 Tax=Hermetia illucens TaxID=343691 RepID=A0A7R8V3V9_HERIL|nr:unnamed protein product [Hermetia illucens]
MLSSYSEFEFGRNYENGCKFTLDNLMEMTTLGKYFYSIYLNYTIDKVQYLQPVPILIRNAFKFNEGQNPSDWQLVRRFQLFDAHQLPSSPTKLPYPFQTDSSKLLRFKMIRYIDSFQMIINIRDGNRISSPLIVLNYKTIYVHRNSSLQSQYDHKFEVRFVIGHDLHFYVELLLPLTMAIGFAFAILRTFNYKTRQNKEYYDFSALCQFVLYLCSNCSNALFSVAIFVCFYVFFVYTGQSVIKLLVPIQQQNLIDVLIGVAFWLKTSYLVAYFWRVTHSDIFFIDWERPRGCDALSTARSNLDTPSVCSSILSNLFGTLRTNDKTLNLALIILIQLILYTIQISVNFIVIEKIYGNPLQQFVDVCSTANISVFLLLHDSYGFYIHGRSPHGFSDVDMSSIIIQLQREAQNMCSRRGLLTGSDNQNYIILVPTNLKIYYAKLLAPFQKAASISQSHFEKEFAQSKITDNPLEKTTTAYNNINRFFAAFIDHSIKDLDYIIKDKTCVEVLLNCEFESYLSDTKGTFYIDNWLSFGKVLLYGNDVQIFLCSLMLFCSIFILSKSPTLSAFITCVIDEIFRTVFRRLIKSNVANKTLIDQRFLI